MLDLKTLLTFSELSRSVEMPLLVIARPNAFVDLRGAACPNPRLEDQLTRGNLQAM